MKKIIAVLLSALMCVMLLTVSGFAVNETFPSVEEGQIEEFNKKYVDEEEAILDMIASVAGKFAVISIIGTLFSVMFVPLLALTIFLGVVSYRNKKKIKKYEAMATATPFVNGGPNYFNNGYQNGNPYYQNASGQGYNSTQNINPQYYGGNNQGGAM